VDDVWAVAVSPWRFIEGREDVLVVVDHASNHVPDDIDLGIDPALHETHIAWDIGAGALAEALALPAYLATASRLVIDLNREEDSTELIPTLSDGVIIPGNPGDRQARIDTYWRPYHSKLRELIAAMRPKMLVSLHSFTPSLSSKPDQRRPWEVGVLYNEDDRAARIAIALLEEAGLNVGDQLPYSGKDLNATMNRHGEGTDTPYLGIEVRQDLIADATGVARMARILLPVIEKCAKTLGQQ
jgi:predicted N-formylglutamate amidohydrolase